jgi:DNA-binding CsgD family transcriptional regulator
MGLFLRSADITRLQNAIRVLASPFASPDIDAWRSECRRTTRELIGADRAAFVLSLPGEPLVRSDPEMQEAATAWEHYYYQLDTGLTEVRRARQLKVFGVHDLYDLTSLKKTELYNDWLKPHGLVEALAIAVDVDTPRLGASLHCYGARGKSDFLSRGRYLLGVALPAFEAGVRALARFSAHRERLARSFDASPVSALVMDFSGRILLRTSRLEQLLALDADKGMVEAAMRRAILALAPVVGHKSASAPDRGSLCTVRTRRRSYRIQATTLVGSFESNGGVGVAWMETPTWMQPTDNQLNDHFQLTRREAEVARCLAAGRSNAEVAAALGVSIHTARHHVERVLRKLRIRTRASVGPRLRGEQVE